MIRRRAFIAAAAALVALPGAGAAHHGWQWADSAEFVLTGVIREVRLGNPHGEVRLEAEDGALWTVELGQPWRHASAGLPDAELQPGVAITLEGHRSADPAELRMKAERVVLAGMRYNLYPDRS